MSKDIEYRVALDGPRHELRSRSCGEWVPTRAAAVSGPLCHDRPDVPSGWRVMPSQRAVRLVDALAEELRRESWMDVTSAHGRVRHVLRQRRPGTWWLIALVDGSGISEEHAEECVDHFAEAILRQHQASNLRLVTGFFNFKRTFGTMLFVLDGSPDRLRGALGKMTRVDHEPMGLGQSHTALMCLTLDMSEDPLRTRGRLQLGRYPSRRSLSRLLARCRSSVEHAG